MDSSPPLCPACWVVLRSLETRKRADEYRKDKAPGLARALDLRVLEIEALPWKECTCKRKSS